MSVNTNYPPRTISVYAGLPAPSRALLDMAHRAIFDARPGGVKEPMLRDPDFMSAGLQVMGAKDYVGVHRDSEELPRWSYHLILSNSGFIVRHPQEETSLMPSQPAGTLVRLSVHKLHTLTADFRSSNWTDEELQEDGEWEAEERGWASLHFGSDELLSPDLARAELLRRVALLESRDVPALGGKLFPGGS